MAGWINALRDRLNWDTFTREIGQGFDTMPAVGITLPAAANLKALNVLKLKKLAKNPALLEKLERAFINANPPEVYGGKPGMYHDTIAKLLGYPDSTEAVKSGLIRYSQNVPRMGGETLAETVYSPENISMLKKLLGLTYRDKMGLDIYNKAGRWAGSLGTEFNPVPIKGLDIDRLVNTLMNAGKLP